MTLREFKIFTRQIDHKLGCLRMTWEGPKPHDFRSMKARGVRFVHSTLYAKNPEDFGLKAFRPVEYAPGGFVRFLVLVGDEAAREQISTLVQSAGYEPVYTHMDSEFFNAVEFNVPVEPL